MVLRAVTMATTDEFGRASKVHLTLHVPGGRRKQMRKLLKPLFREADPNLNLVVVHETLSTVAHPALGHLGDIPKYCTGSGVLSTPSLSLIVFFPEDVYDEHGASLLWKFPWKFHHRIELQNSRGSRSRLVRGRQEFYSLSREYPLCSVCSWTSGRQFAVRFQLFVRNFRAMLEFYRLLTESEMESSKADFALFTVSTSENDFLSFAQSLDLSSSSPAAFSAASSSMPATWTGILLKSGRLRCTVQLVLKYCPYLEPYPLNSAYLTFLVRNMTALKTVLPGTVAEISPNTFIVKDPDGNRLLVRDVKPPTELHPNDGIQNSIAKSQSYSGNTAITRAQGYASGKVRAKGGYCESQDSGRYSDSERCSSELDHCLERLSRDVALNITDYSESSDTDSDQLELGANGARLVSRCSENEAAVTDLSNSMDAYELKSKTGELSTIHLRPKKIVYL